MICNKRMHPSTPAGNYVNGKRLVHNTFNSHCPCQVRMPMFLGPVLLTFLRHVARISANGIAAFIKKAALPLAKILATCHKNVSNTGPWQFHWYKLPFIICVNDAKGISRSLGLSKNTHMMSCSVPLLPRYEVDGIYNDVNDDTPGTSFTNMV